MPSTMRPARHATVTAKPAWSAPGLSQVEVTPCGAATGGADAEDLQHAAGGAAEAGVMPHPTGQVESTSTIEKPFPSSWTSNAPAAFNLKDSTRLRTSCPQATLIAGGIGGASWSDGRASAMASKVRNR